jgi:hypothetical protein
MLVQLSTGAVNAMMDDWGLRGVLEDAGMELRLYSGTIPSTADAALGGATLLVTIRSGVSPLTWATPVTNGTLVKNPAETWSGTAVATATATFGRFTQVGDDGLLNTTAVRVQGDVANIGAFINLDNPAIVSGAVQTINSATFTLPRQ